MRLAGGLSKAKPGLTDDALEFAPLAVELFVPDVREAVDFYTRNLGFRLHRAEPPPPEVPVFALTSRGTAVIMFMSDAYYAGGRDALAPGRGEGVDIRIMVNDVDAVDAMAREAGMVLLRPIGDRDYGLRDFIVRDPFGFRLRFASPLR
jgi:catechol 2,3-dioxygenase-like lactoylglutathione lyase family enzyme